MRTYTAAISFFLLSAFGIRAQNFIDGQAARAEFGQYTFTFGGATPGTTQTLPNQQILGGVSGLAWANGVLYVADSNRLASLPQDNRVVMFNTGLIPAPNADLTHAHSYSTYQCNVCAFPAFNQLGQPNFTAQRTADSTNPNAFDPGLDNDPSKHNMRTPTAVATDGNILAVADTDNNRVLIWNSIPVSLNQPANIVLGQSDFTHATIVQPPTASSLLGPQGVWIQNGKLFVADTQNYRVLIWNSIPTSNNQPADVVLGQSNFTSGTQAACDPNKSSSTIVAAANELCNPVSVTADNSHVFVSDLGFNRVLIWNSIPGANGQNADVVVGQPDMASAKSNNPAVCKRTGQHVVCDANLNFPRYALSDGTRLFVADGGNDRVIIFNSIPTQNGTPANVVLGQPTFFVNNVTSQTISVASTAVDTFSAVDVTPTPTSLAFDGVNLYVSDPLDNRVLVFTPGNTPLPDNSIVNWASQIIRQEGVVTIGIPGKATANDTITLTLGSKTYTYTVKADDTPDTIAQGLVDLVNKDGGDPNAIAFFAGTGSGSLYLSSKGVNLPFDSIAFSAASSNPANETAVASGNGYLTAGNAATGSPGMLVAINGTNLSDLPPEHPAVASLTGTIPTSLGGAQVFMDGVATPVFSASSAQVVSEIPFTLFGRNSTSIYVRTTHSDGSVTVTNASPIYIAQANPGIFDAPATPGQARPWPATGVFHQPGNPQAVVDLTGTVNAGDVLTIKVADRSYSYTEKSGDTLASVVSGLVAAINNGNDPQVTAQPGGAFNRVVVVARQAGAAGNNIAISTSTSSSSKITLTAYTNATCCNVVSGSPITASNPAAPGETITLSAAGLGIVTNLAGTRLINVPVGQPYSLDVPNSAEAPVSATMGGATAQVVSAGLPTGSYGIYQVQLIVPQNQATNATTPVFIAQNAFVSNTVTIPVGPANSNPNQPPVGSSPISIAIDAPSASSPALSGPASVAGWAIDQNALISSVTVSVDGVSVGAAQYGGNRADACAAHPSSASCANGNNGVGYNYLLDTTPFADGTHTVSVTATDVNGSRLTVARTFTASNYSGPNPTAIGIGSPGGGNPSYQGLANFNGWAVNATSVITSLTYSIDGVARGNVPYGNQSRPDVCALYPTVPGCANGANNVGWNFNFNTTGLNNGTHIFAITAVAANGQKNIQASAFTVANWTTGNPILLAIDSPNPQSGPLTGIQNIGGWALDPVSSISAVLVAVDDIPLGAAAYHGNRADACKTNSAPDCPNVGWTYALDSTRVPDGQHTLAVSVIPFSGQGFTRTIPFQVANMGTQMNATQVAVDIPNAATPPFSGFAHFGGWSYNDSAPISSIEIYVDGILNGYAVYGGNRSDVCTLRGNKPGCPNLGWNYLLDTSILANGPHSLQVTANAANGQRATAGSSFTVSNTAGGSPTAVSIAQPSAQSGPYQGLAVLSGSAVSTSAPITSITVTVDGYPYGPATYTPAGINATVNWTFLLNTVQFADGTHTLGVMAKAADGTFSVASATLLIGNWATPNPTRIAIDRPNAQTPPFTGIGTFGGWALNRNSAIVAMTIAIDGISYGSAMLGGNRPDACASNPTAPGCPNVGWNFAFDSTLLANGTHTVSVTATTAAGQTSTSSSSFSVGN
ncbi:MAG TPA: hypothetical protein VH477_17320 [Bryobacteraceae bacterium]